MASLTKSLCLKRQLFLISVSAINQHFSYLYTLRRYCFIAFLFASFEYLLPILLLAFLCMLLFFILFLILFMLSLPFFKADSYDNIRIQFMPVFFFNPGFFQSYESFSSTLDGVFYEPGGTRTDAALSKALSVFASSGQRRASKVLVVVTDNPTNDIRISKENLVVGRDLVEKPSENLKSYEVISFGVGVKYGLTETEREDLDQELKMITQDEEGDKRIVGVENYEELLTSASKMAGKICLGTVKHSSNVDNFLTLVLITCRSLWELTSSFILFMLLFIIQFILLPSKIGGYLSCY